MFTRLATLGLLIFLISCTRHNIREQKQWAAFFQKYHIDSACFELADNSHDQVYYYNLPRSSARYSPASTFKIMNSLIALETGVAPDEELIIPWDKTIRPRTEWNKDMTMREAFQVSCVPYYQELARRIGITDLKKWIDTVQYGNRETGSVVDEFWLNNSLQISNDEQVGLMKKLYFDKLPFSPRSQRIVRNLMLQEDSSAYRLYYKTGTSANENKFLAWIVGFVERKETQKSVLGGHEETNYKPYFFSMNFETNDTLMDTRTVRLDILKSILRERKILPSVQ
ncbi:MAG TPA: penicillin-binding transpeptidase domain-containing protein [Chitinophagaceae bacterium]|nr:penicillin-binding transpeptidase domain-containing protein [Chitinophagaceae bacterium]